MKTHLYLGALLLLITLMVWYVTPGKFAYDWLLILVSLVAAVLYNHYRFTLKSSKLHPLLSLDIVFLTGQSVIGFSVSVMILLGLVQFKDLTWRYPAKNSLLPSVAVSAVGAAAFSVGFMLMRTRSASVLRKLANKPTYVPTFRSPMFVLATAVPGMFLLGVFLIVEGANYIGGRYVGTREIQEVYAVMFWCAQVFLTVAVSAITLTIKRPTDLVNPISGVALGAWLVMLAAFAIHGDRGGIVQCGGPILFVIASRIPKRLGIPAIAAALIGGLVFTSIVRVAREKEERSLSSLVQAITEMDFSESLQDGASNLGGSGLITPVAIAESHAREHTMGKHTINAVLGIAPYSRRTLQGLGVLPEWEFPSSSNYFTFLIIGPQAKWGIGTNATAEFYLEFGIVGVLGGFFIVGVVAAWVQRYANRDRPLDNYHVLHLYCVGLFAIMARYSPTDLIFRNLVYGIVVIIVADRICRLFIKRKRVRKRAVVPAGGPTPLPPTTASLSPSSAPRPMTTEPRVH